MSIEKIKNLASTLKSGSIFSYIKSSTAFGNTTISVELKELFDLIDEYIEPDPKVDTPPKTRTRKARSTKKETTTE